MKENSKLRCYKFMFFSTKIVNFGYFFKLNICRTQKDIGLGEALIAISKKFNGTCEALKTKKYIHGFLGTDD